MLMQPPRFILVIGLVGLVAVTLCLIIPWGPAALPPGGAPRPGEQVLVPAGTVLRIPGFQGVDFNVSSGGGQLVGEAEVDHTSVGFIGAYPVGAEFNCPAELPGYWGGPWTYIGNQTLAAGAYTWGAVCGTAGNITVTQSVVIQDNG